VCENNKNKITIIYLFRKTRTRASLALLVE